MDAPILMTIAEVGRALALSRRSIWRRIRSGDLEVVYLGHRSPRVPAESVRALVARSQFLTQPEGRHGT